MLKKLFYASASILMLALAYHFGAASAGAQSPGTIQGASAGPATGYATGVVGRTFYYKRHNSNEPGGTVPDPVPGDSPVIATQGSGPGSIQVAVLENGDVYSRNLNESAWVYFGNLVGSPTHAAQQTWGQLKAQYRK